MHDHARTRWIHGHLATRAAGRWHTCIRRPRLFDRRETLRRLAVGGAIVWSAPLISKTAFAQTAASCIDRTLDWNTLATGSTFNSATVAGTTVTLSPSSFFGGSGPRTTNRTIIAANIGGLPTKGLRLEQNAVTNGGQTITFTFSQTVFDVQFSITDIDNTTGAWSDRVSIVTPAAFTFTVPSGSSVTGTGTIGDPFRNTTNTNFNNNQPGGNVQLTFPGPLTQITVRFACAAQQSSNQLINFSPILFCR